MRICFFQYELLYTTSFHKFGVSKIFPEAFNLTNLDYREVFSLGCRCDVRVISVHSDPRIVSHCVFDTWKYTELGFTPNVKLTLDRIMSFFGI